MKFFIDSCDLDQIKYWINCGIAKGITTNPIIIKKQTINTNLIVYLSEIVCFADKLPVSIQVTENDPEKIMQQAKEFSQIRENVVIKVPILNEEGESLLPVIKQLSIEGCKINATACMSALQATMAADAGARYVSLLYARVNDNGGDGLKHIKLIRQYLEQNALSCELIIGSIREVNHLLEMLSVFPHIVTVSPEVLKKAVFNSLTQKTVIEFYDAAKSK
jgi:transaldolase